MYLATDLPMSNSCSTVAVFVDRLTNMVHFAPCRKEVTTAEYAKLFVDTVFHLLGMPEVIVSEIRDLLKNFGRVSLTSLERI